MQKEAPLRPENAATPVFDTGIPAVTGCPAVGHGHNAEKWGSNDSRF